MTKTSGIERGGRWVLAGAIAVAALAMGTVHTITLCGVTAMLSVSAGLTWWGAERAPFRPRLAATLLLTAGVLLTAYTALQTVPLPIRWLALIAPRNADIWSRALAPLHKSGPSWAPISMDPSATRIEVLKGIAYLLAFVTALRIARTRDGIGFLSTAIVATGAAVAVAALLHPAFGARKLYGIIHVSSEVLVSDRHVAPFLNRNNLAGYLNVAFCLAFAATIAPEPRWPRPIVAASAILLASTQVWVGSRGGVGSMLLGACLVLVLSRVSRMTHRPGRRAEVGSIIVAMATVAGMAMVIFGGSTEVSDELFETDLTKFVLLRQAIRMVPAFFFFGTGRGAFESTFPAFRDIPGILTFTHPENVVLQWLIEWGVPVGLAGLGAVGFALRPSTVLARSSIATGAWAGLVAIAVQSLVDLGSEIPGLVMAPVICAAIVVGGTAGRSTRWPVERWGEWPRALAMVAAFAAVVGIGMAAIGMGAELSEDRAAMREAVPYTAAGPMHARAEAALLRHPAEPYLPFIVGWRAARERDDDPMPWLGATLERSRVAAPAHLVLAQLLARRSPSQARLEYRLAIEQAPEIETELAAETPRLVTGYDDAMELVPAGKAGLVELKTLSEALASRLPATRVRLDEELAFRAPTFSGPALHAAQNAVIDLEAPEDTVWCDGALRTRCVAQALAATARAQLVEPSTCEPRILRARARIADSDARTGLAELAAVAEGATDRVACLKALVDLANRAHEDKRADEAMTKLAASGCADDAECADNFAWLGATAEQRGDTRRALVFYRRAYERAPHNDALLEAAARLAASSGLHSEAHDDYERLARKHPEEPRWHNAASAEGNAAMNAASAL